MDIRRLLAVALFGIAGVLGGCSQKVTPVGGLTPVAAAPARASPNGITIIPLLVRMAVTHWCHVLK